MAEQNITQGLSRGARLLLGSVSAFLGLGMMLIAPPTDKAPFFYVFGGFCLLISLACFTAGRVRQFMGSVIGTIIFLMGIWYLGNTMIAGRLWSASHADASVDNALRYLLVIGIPGIAYAYRVRFGFRKERRDTSPE